MNELKKLRESRLGFASIAQVCKSEPGFPKIKTINLSFNGWLAAAVNTLIQPSEVVHQLMHPAS